MSGAAPVHPVNSDVSAHASNYNWALCSASLPPAFTQSAILLYHRCLAPELSLTFDSNLLPVHQQDCWYDEEDPVLVLYVCVCQTCFLSL